MGAEHSFSVGDKVKHAVYGEMTVSFGPFTHLSGVTMALVETSDGRHAYSEVRLLAPAASYAVGDKVKHTHFGDGEIVFGPFKYGADDDACLMLDARGDHRHVTPEYLTLIAADTHKYHGVVYDLGADYEDASGDVWKFERINGIVRGSCNGVPVSWHNRELESVVGVFGPLTKVS